MGACPIGGSEKERNFLSFSLPPNVQPTLTHARLSGYINRNVEKTFFAHASPLEHVAASLQVKSCVRCRCMVARKLTDCFSSTPRHTFDEDPRTFVEDFAKLALRNGSEVTFDFFLVEVVGRYLQPLGSRLTIPLGTLSWSSWSIAALSTDADRAFLVRGGSTSSCYSDASWKRKSDTGQAIYLSLQKSGHGTVPERAWERFRVPS